MNKLKRYVRKIGPDTPELKALDLVLRGISDLWCMETITAKEMLEMIKDARTGVLITA